MRFPALVAVLLLGAGPCLRGADEPRPGLAVSFSGQGVKGLDVLDNILLYVPAGESASPFIPAGPFTAIWEGFIASDIRADYTFSAECAGELKLTINETPALAGTSTNGQRLEGATVRLNKGANRLKVEFHSPQRGDAFLRVSWSNRETPLNPPPKSAFTYLETVDLRKAMELHAGRDLFAESRCAKCHAAPAGMAEMGRDAPSLSGIGAIRRFDWLQQWIRDPRSQQASAHMPAIFSGTNATGNSTAIAAYLTALNDGAAAEPVEGNPASGRLLFEKLQCAACHLVAGERASNDVRYSLVQVGQKFNPAALGRFLERPEERYAWTMMPNFQLTSEEAADVAAWLMSQSDPPAEIKAPSEPGLIESGRKLVIASGCLNCHTLGNVKGELSAKPLAALPADRWNSGCLAENPPADSKAPRFGFTDSERSALRAFGATDRASLDRNVAADFAVRQSAHLNCRACHGKVEGIPAFDRMGGKLKPEWSAKFIAGEIDVKPRPWLEARMPAFPAYAATLGVGLAASHGLPPHTPPDPPAEPELARAGQKLVSAKSGFSCVTCHAAGQFVATQPSDSPGINFALIYDRLQPDYFRRWVRSPASIDPASKMPAFFDEEGKSPLREIFNGDGPKTIQALWEYIRLGDALPPPG